MRSFMIPRRLIIFALPSVLALFAFWWAHSTPRVIAQGPPVCVTPPPNMVSWWPGDGNANDIQGSNNGTLQGGAAFVPGKVGQAFSFNGTDAYVRVPDNANLYPGAGSFTVDAWIKTTQMSAGNAVILAHYECANGCPPGGGSVYAIYVNGNGKLLGILRDSAGTQQNLTGATVVADGVYHHIALVRDTTGLQMQLYVDGVVDASAPLTVTGTMKDDDSELDPFTIGAIIQGGANHPSQLFQGQVDEVEYFNRVLAASEIQGIFNAGSAGKCKPVANNPPVARCQDVTVSAGLGCQANASIDNGSSDAEDGTALTFSQSPPGPYLQGMTSVMLTVTDSQGATSSCSATVTVVDRTAPVILACATDKTLSANADCQAVIPNLLSEVIARDNCRRPGMPLLLTRTQSPPAGTLVGLGTTPVTITVADPAGNMSTCTANVTVVDMTPPVITLIGQPIALWPPNHQYETINVSQLVAGASDNCGGDLTASVFIAQVSSDEPENATGGGDGNTFKDIVIAADCKSVRLRAERQGSGNGRVYTITFKVKDAAGNMATATAKVTVSKNQNGAEAVDDGPSYTVLSGCP